MIMCGVDDCVYSVRFSVLEVLDLLLTSIQK